MELIAAYTSFANNGTRVEPIGIQRIEDRQGNILYQSTVKREQVLDPEHNWLMLDMMRDVMRCQPGSGLHRCGTAAGAVGGLRIRWPAKPARRTTTPTRGSWASRPKSSPASGSVTTCSGAS